MFFASTPSLIVSLVLAFFYLANLAFYAANRQQDAAYVAEVVPVGHENERCLPHTIPVCGEGNILKYKSYSNIWAGDIHVWDFCGAIANRDTFHRVLPDFSSPVFDPGICWKQFSRPPPVS